MFKHYGIMALFISAVSFSGWLHARPFDGRLFIEYEYVDTKGRFEGGTFTNKHGHYIYRFKMHRCESGYMTGIHAQQNRFLCTGYPNLIVPGTHSNNISYQGYTHPLHLPEGTRLVTPENAHLPHESVWTTTKLRGTTGPSRMTDSVDGSYSFTYWEALGGNGRFDYVSSTRTTRSGMHACSGGRALFGLHLGGNKFLCSDVYAYKFRDNGLNGITRLSVVEEKVFNHAQSKSRQNTQACPKGWLMTGYHRNNNSLLCARYDFPKEPPFL